MADEQRASGLHERPHRVGAGLAPTVAADEHGVTRLRIEQILPDGRPWDGRGHDGGKGTVHGQIAGDDERVAAADGGGHHFRDPGVDTEQSELHTGIVPVAGSFGQPSHDPGRIRHVENALPAAPP